MNSKINLIDDKNNEVGVEEIKKAHQHPAKFHRAVSVWIFNDDNQVLLQQRSQFKIVCPKEWGNGICGNLRVGENFKECAKRRLKEELGIKDIEIRPIYEFKYRAYCNDLYGENELDKVFRGQYLGDVKYESSEVMDYLWVDWEEIVTSVNKVISEMTTTESEAYVYPEKTLNMSQKQLKEKTKSLFINLKDRLIKLTPWTVMMTLELAKRI